MTPFVLSLAVLGLTYVLLFIDRIHRTILGIAGATAMVVGGKLLGFYDALPGAKGALNGTALGAIDWNTLGLLFGMMVIVGIFEETGIFEYISIKLAKLTRGSPWRLMLALGGFTFVASALVDNVTTVIFVGGVTVSIASMMGISPVPLLIGEAIMSGMGGMATLVGDPPNIMIGSAAGLSFLDFVVTLAPVALIVALVSNIAFRWLYRGEFRHESSEVHLQRLMALDEREELRDRVVLAKMLVVLALVLGLFLAHHALELLPSEVALIGASLALLWVRPRLVEILNRVKWDVLLFFAGLFVIVGGLEAAGVLRTLAQWIGEMVLIHPLWALLVVLWGAAFVSAIIDNVPFTIAVIPIILNLERWGVDVIPLWWALAAGVAIGGCATPIGASANVYVLSLAERAGTRIDFRRWLRVGVPTVLVQLSVTSLLLYGMVKLGFI